MTTGATGQLGLALPVQGELSGTWGDTVNNGITQYTNIAIAGTLTLTGDGAVTLANTTGDASASNITSTLSGAGTVTAQFAIVRVSGTTTTKVVTGPSYSKTYVVDNASSYAVTFKASGQTGVSVAAAEKVTVVFNGTDYIKLAGTIANAAGSNTQIQFNNGGLFGASANLTWDGTTLSSTQINITGQGTLRLQDTTGGEYVGLRAPASLGASYTLTWPADDGTSGQALITDGSGVLSWSTAASGDVYGPASATDNAVSRFDGTTGKLIQDSVVLIGDTGAVTGVTDLTASGSVTLSGGTANGVTYLNGSKVLTSGSALNFDGAGTLNVINGGGTGFSTQDAASNYSILRLGTDVASGYAFFQSGKSGTGTTLPFSWRQDSSELMRLTSTGLGVGTSSLSSLAQRTIDLNAASNSALVFKAADTTFAYLYADNAANEFRMYGGSSKNLTFYANAAEQMRLTSTGLGIGTSSPAAKLNTSIAVSGSATQIHYLLSETGSSSSTGMQIKATNSTYSWDAGAITFKREAAANNYSLLFDTSNGGTNSTRMTLDSAGNLGLGVTPNAGTSGRVLQTSNAGHFMASGPVVYIDANAYFDSGWKYITTAAASNYYQSSGAHIWNTAASGNAGDAISFSQAMTLDASGKLGIGNTNPSSFDNFANNLVVGTGSGSEGITIYGGSTDSSNISFADGTGAASYQGYIQYAHSTDSLGFYVNYSGSANARMIIDSSGNVGIGTSSPGQVLEVRGLGSSGGQTGAYVLQTLYDNTAGAINVGGGLGFAGNDGVNSRVTFATINGSKENATSGNFAGYLSFKTRLDGGSLTERMRLDSAGNLGLGTAPSAWGTFKAIEIASAGSGVISAGSTDIRLTGNAYFNGTNWKYAATNVASMYAQNSGIHDWYIAGSGSAGANISWTTAMTLDASGNLGVGTTSIVNNIGGGTTMNLGGLTTTEMVIQGTYQYINNAPFQLTFKNLYTGGSVLGSIGAYLQGAVNSGALIFSTASGGTNAERARIDSSGNLLVNTTQAITGSKVSVENAGFSAGSSANSNQTNLLLSGYGYRSGSTTYGNTSIRSTYSNSNNAASLEFYVASSGTNTAEAARIDSSGNLLVGTTSTSNGALINWYKASGTIETSLGGITTAQNHIVFANPNGNVGSIQVDGSATSFNTSSDYRLKNTIAPMTGALAKVALIKPCTYKWNVDGSDGQGFIAHELAEVVPQCVTGEKDAVDEEGNPVYQGIDTSFLVATVVAAIQEQQAIIESLKARLDAANL